MRFSTRSPPTACGARKSTVKAFEDVRRVSVAAGEVLVEAGSPRAFVYVAVGCSLRIEQLGGYRDIEVRPWIPIGVTGVVRRAERNSTVVAAGPGDVLMIPRRAVRPRMVPALRAG